MEFAKRFYSLLRERCVSRGGQKSMIELTGLKQAALNKIVTGETKDPGLVSVSAIVDALGLEVFVGSEIPDCADKLAKAQAEIEELKTALAIERGRLDSMREAYNIALEKLAASAPIQREYLPKGDNQNEC